MESVIAVRAFANCLIISANQVVTPYPVYPLGSAYVAGAMTSCGHQVHHFDLLADGGLKGLAEFLTGKHFDLVGVSIRNLDTVDSADPKGYLGGIVETVECIRARIDTTLVIGGPAFSIMPEPLMELLQADYGVVGEGEVLTPWLASELAAGRRPTEKILRAEPEEGSWRPSNLTVSSAKYYTDHGGMLNVQTKRGCPYGCSYCSYPTIEGSRIRHRDPDEVVDEVMRLQAESGAKYLFFADSVFNDPDKRYLEIAEALVRRKNSVPWSAFFRPHNIETDDLKLMKRAGLAAMELGTDAAADETLEGIYKKFRFADVLRTHERIVAEDIPCAHFIMFGGPNEDENTLATGLKNIERLKDSVVFAFIGIRIFPGTGIFDRAVAEGVIEAGQSLLEPEFYYSPLISREVIEASLKASFADQLDRVYPCHEFEARIAMLHKMGKVGPLWDLMLKKGRR
ncbi:MAG: radical SAM protein [Desulfobulbaceae bacterium]|nr:radical SAM protein [Desulfobulbaceae bacterium]